MHRAIYDSSKKTVKLEKKYYKNYIDKNDDNTISYCVSPDSISKSNKIARMVSMRNLQIKI